jgi:hypothetical protein
MIRKREVVWSVTDNTLPPFPTRRQLREAERNSHLPSRLELRDAVDADQREKARAQALTLTSAPERESDSGNQSPVTGAVNTVAELRRPRPERPDIPVTRTIPVASVVEHDTSLDLAPTTRPATRSQVRLDFGPSTHTFPVTISPKAEKVRPVEHKSGGQRALTWAVMATAPLLFIGVSMPVNLFYTSDIAAPAIAFEDDQSGEDEFGQAFIVDSADPDITTINRESWSVTSYAEVLRTRYGGRSFSYSVNNAGAIRWPFPTAVPISSGFGNRIAPCRYCSSYHRGVDFVPGRGKPTYAMADGVVTQSEFSGGYGQHVYIEHQINGQSVMTVYAHLQRDSSPLRVGDRVSVGDFVGLVGSTGTSTGAHLHFEVRIDGVYVDPFAFLTANAG